jgi:hypothetical protein
MVIGASLAPLSSRSSQKRTGGALQFAFIPTTLKSEDGMTKGGREKLDKQKKAANGRLS